MNHLPLELHRMVAAFCGPATLAVLCRCSNPFNSIYTTPLYEQDVKLYCSSAVWFIILYYTDEAIAIKALKKAVAVGADLEKEKTLPLRYMRPRWTASTVTNYELHRITPLHMAAARGLGSVVSFLLEQKAPINAVAGKSQWTPLLLALCERQGPTAKQLLYRGASLTMEGLDINALHLASAANLPDIVTYLVREKGMDINSEDRDGDTPLVYAILSPDTTKEFIAYLVQIGADVNKTAVHNGQRLSPLGFALRHEIWDLAEALLDCEADPSGTREVGPNSTLLAAHDVLRPLQIALLSKGQSDPCARKKIIVRLLDLRADLPAEVRIDGWEGPLLSKLVRSHLKWEVKLLLKGRYVDVEGRDFRGITALEEALSPTSGSPEIAILLLQHGARVPRRSAQNILDLVDSLYQTSNAVTLYNTLRSYRLLACMFQVLFDHCSAVVPEDSDDVTREFLANSPPLMVDMIKAKSGHKLTNEKVLEQMRDQFYTTKVRPRKAARPMRNWWMDRNVRRLQRQV
ncbi:ankyrin repeat-containing domain protein [Hypoxylon rubiginosum]|uniref:Ankyrin repeat-containing domain protein n=1 Tax=Hypoxylon rubiginosum TaxID=110542 RepID=A0ACC0CK90_9PEZI|nr:ankyrin repeat-containing domain protein [Hypoxylon rubiginosum]